MSAPRPHQKKPCVECPYRRASLPGWLGNDTPEGFMATTMADHPMPCHLTVDYERKDWKKQADKAPLCAGALIFFSNTVKRSRDPKRPELPADRELIFSNAREFIAHHESGRLSKLKPVTEAPKKGDRADKRCAFTSTSSQRHAPVGDRDWCYGCSFYVCDDCDKNPTLMGAHDVTEHEHDDEGDEL